ncbi:peptidoglycan editing factor PgeF [Roseateles koreensis]|uniref:Purine nucleoside phosphorylase n=1 Tax=Roseateles koreensis TaxID=2987526 RepID=A0ABT5KUZ6_9BURK|nr:peptidoglycan editing factor PgeF [Roseateles koreensis]MDC8786739.1 peptidoglycan editing factor PgeF [Roseateles koreensis]
MLNEIRLNEVSPLIHPDWLRPAFEGLPVRAFMTTRAGGVSAGMFASLNVGSAVGDAPEAVAQNRARVSQALGAEAVFLQQVHGVDVAVLCAAHETQAVQSAPGHLWVADAGVSTQAGVGVAIQVADCLPVLFAAPGGVAGAHAGWRGLAGGVLENTVAALCTAAGCRPEKVQAWLGACIGPDAFEVGADVLQAFGQAPVLADTAFFRYRPKASGEARWHADLAGLARLRLQALGVGRVSGGEWCTFSERSRFFSFRREPPGGRMVAAIALC